MHSTNPLRSDPRRTQRVLHGLLGLALSLLIGGVVQADDTEVFFPVTDGDLTETIRPNILFIMDTSGSMGSTDGVGTTRLDRMKTAMKQILDEISPNTNVGLMRLSDDEGGPVLFPVSHVEADADAIEASCFVDGTGGVDTGMAVVSSIASGPSDSAGELLATGAVTVTTPTLEMGRSGSVAGGVTTGIFQGRSESNRRDSFDDAEERSNGRNFDNDESVLQLGHQGRTIGLRFTGVNVPQGAKVVSARLEIVVTSRRNNNTDARVFAEATDNSADFNDNRTVVGRPLTSASSALWDVPSVNRDTRVASPDIAAAIQEVVDRPGWMEGNALTLIVEASGRREVINNTGGNDRPILVVEYEVASAPASDSMVGLRFPEVFIPKGVRIQSAYIDFKPSNTRVLPASFLIEAGAADNAALFSGDIKELSTRPKVAGNVTWSAAQVGPWNGIDATPGDVVPAGTLRATPDISALLQPIVNRAGWCGGQAMTVFVRSAPGNTGAREFHTSLVDPAFAPQLYLTYDREDPAVATGCNQNLSLSQITDGNDDGEERLSNGSISLNRNELTFGRLSNNEQIVAMRFNNVQAPRNGEILAAELSVVSSSTAFGGATFTITAEAVDNAGPLSTSTRHISNRANNSVAGSITWTLPDFDQVDVTHTSPDLSSLIQSVVNRPGWSPGQSIVIYIRGSGTRKVWSANGSLAKSPQLRIRSKGVLRGKSVRQRLKEAVDDFNATGFTPLAEVLTEAAFYFRGEEVHFGRTRGSGFAIGNEGGDGTICCQDDLVNARLMRISHCASYTGGTQVDPSGCTAANPNSSNCELQRITGNARYKSPIVDPCQSNNIVLLSDGQPNQNNNRQLVRGLAGGNCSGNNCGIDLARFLATGDQSSTVDGTQTVNVFTVGFADLSAADYLRSVAAAGNGTFSPASGAEDLAARFREIIAQILDRNTTFVAPAVTINSFNRLTHLDQLYFALFRPEVDPHWRGNLKRFRLLGNPGRIVDQRGSLAVDESTGFFFDDAYSFWTDLGGPPDGGTVTEGGATARIVNPAARKVYTNISGNNLTAANNVVSAANTAITNARLGLDPAAPADVRQRALDWARGIDVNDEDSDGDVTDTRRVIGDPLHSEPVLVSYGGTEDNPDITVFVGTNHGFIHAIDGPTGNEVFAFIPDELLPILSPLQRNVGTWATRPYGMDGPLVALRFGASTHYVVAGMRRGGRSYYALDVSNRTSPRIAWKIQGGSTAGFNELGQTWSQPIAATVNFGGAAEKVLFFGGGYDVNQDSRNSPPLDDSMGRALFMVRQSDGALLWSAGHTSTSANLKIPEMTASIPSTPAVLDLNNDGLVDRIYVADMNARIFRFDLNPEGGGAATFASGGLFAALGGSSAAENRRFYNSPDVALVLAESAEPRLTISIGSGFRAHPLDNSTQDRFYTLFDDDVLPSEETFPAAGFIPINDPDTQLFDATDNSLNSADPVTREAAREEFLASRGAFIDMRQGEKILTTSRTINNMIVVASFQPGETRLDACAAGEGVARLYVLDVFGLGPVADLNDSGGELTTGDRDKELSIAGIPPNPVILFPDNPDGPIQPVIFVGPESFQPNIDITAEKTTWEERDPWNP